MEGSPPEAETRFDVVHVGASGRAGLVPVRPSPDPQQPRVPLFTVSYSPITNCPVFTQLTTNKALCTTERLKLPFITDGGSTMLESY